MCSPNPVYDAKNPGHTPHRDIALEIAKRLKPLGKRLILYFPSEAEPTSASSRPWASAAKAMRIATSSFCGSIRVKFGTLHHGWWFDACGPHPDAYWNKWLAALRAGNPEVAVAFSQAEFCCGKNVEPICRLADYHAGEIHLVEDGKIRHDFLYPPGN